MAPRLTHALLFVAMPFQNEPTVKQQSFIEHLLSGKSQRESARLAGYNSAASEIKKAPAVRNALIRARKRRTATRERTLQELSTIALGDIRGLFDAQGNLRPIGELSRQQAALIAQFEVIKKNAEAGDGHVDTVHKVKLKDSIKALEILARYHGLLAEKVEVQGNITVSWQAPVQAEVLSVEASEEYRKS